MKIVLRKFLSTKTLVFSDFIDNLELKLRNTFDEIKCGTIECLYIGIIITDKNDDPMYKEKKAKIIWGEKIINKPLGIKDSNFIEFEVLLNKSCISNLKIQEQEILIIQKIIAKIEKIKVEEIFLNKSLFLEKIKSII